MTPRSPRALVVLGYSDGGRGELHPVCAARLARAAEISTADDLVVLSGWARVPGTPSEAELMAAAWSGCAGELVVDPVARTTVGNAVNAAGDIRRVRASHVVIVTSRWHAARARAAFRLVLRDAGAEVETVSPPEARHLRASLRELLLWALLPVQLWRAARKTPSPAVPAQEAGLREAQNVKPHEQG